MGEPSLRFKRNLVAESTEVEGVAFVDVRDPQTGNSFRFYELEYQLAMLLDGRPLEQVVASAGADYGLDLTPEGVEEFAGRLAELGFLDRAAVGEGASPGEDMASAEAEWLDTESGRTVQSTVDPALMTEAAQDLTPSVPVSPPEDAARPAPLPPRPAAQPPAAARAPSGPVTQFRVRPPTPSGVTELPSDALTEVSDSGIRPHPTAAAVPSKRQQAEVSEDIDVATPPPERPTARAPVAPPVAAAPPRGMAERRQPPRPDAVVASPVHEEGSRALFTAPPPARAARRGPVVALLLLLLVGGAAAVVYFRVVQPRNAAPHALRVRVVAPKPTAIYRWFSTSGSVADLGARSLAFESAGRLAELMPAGTAFAPGDVLAKLQGSAPLETELGRHESRVAFYEQVRDSMKAAGNQAEVKQAEAKLAEKQKQVQETRAALDKLVLKATEPGQVLETMAKVGGSVAARAPIMKWKGKLLHGDFTLDQEDFTTATKLDFCRIEVTGPAPAADGGRPTAAAPAGEGGRFVDCKLPPPPPGLDANARGASPLRKFAVALPTDAGLATGQPLRLARLRYDAVFPLPPSAIVHGEGGDKVYVATPAGVSELRAITVAESREEALVIKGLKVGDEVIVDPPTDLPDGTRVAPER